MMLRIRSEHPEVVLALLDQEHFLNGALMHGENAYSVWLKYDNEDYKVELRQWCMNAIGCGLVTGLEFE